MGNVLRLTYLTPLALSFSRALIWDLCCIERLCRNDIEECWIVSHV